MTMQWLYHHLIIIIIVVNIISVVKIILIIMTSSINDMLFHKLIRGSPDLCLILVSKHLPTCQPLFLLLLKRFIKRQNPCLMQGYVLYIALYSEDENLLLQYSKVALVEALFKGR